MRHHRAEVLKIALYLRCSLPSGFPLSCFSLSSFISSFTSQLLVGGLCVPLMGSLAFAPSMEGNEVCNGLRLGVETMVGRMVMWMKVIGLGEQAEQ
jgi:hypothetical protein